jgi:hypothetical protein
MDRKINPVSDQARSPLRTAANGMVVDASRGRIITPEMIKQAEEEDLNEEIGRMLLLSGHPSKQGSAIGE